MKTIKGPGIFLAQFLGDDAPFNALDSLARFMADLGYKGVQIPTWDSRMIDLKLASESLTYCDEYKVSLPKSGWKSPNWQLISRGNWLPSIRPTMRFLIVLGQHI